MSVDEFNLGNFTDTGLTTPFSRYTFQVHIKWTDDAGVKHVHGP
jgi:hypothetical protein